MKNYIFDARVLLNPMYQGRGIARYVKSLIENSYLPGDVVYFDEHQIGTPEAVEFLKAGFSVSSEIPSSEEYIFLLSSLFEEKLPFELGFYQWSAKQEVHVVLYDLIPLISQDEYLRGATAQSRYLACLHVLRKAKKVFCISEHTRNDVIRLMELDPEKCVNIFTGVDDTFFKNDPNEATVRQDSLSQKPFICSVSGLHPSKNIAALVNAFADPKSELYLDYDLRIIMPPSVSLTDILGLLPTRQRRRMRGKIHLVSDLTEDEMKWHYKNCAVFAYVSRYEGFGLPPAEAIASGACVLSTGRSSLSEVVVSKKARLDPDSSEAIAKVIRDVVGDPSLQEVIKKENAVILPRLRWINVAQTLNEYRLKAEVNDVAQEVIVKKSQPIDVFTALPPDRSGVVEYTLNFLNAIADDYQIRVFYPESSQPIGLDPRIKTYPLSVARDLMGPAERRFFVLGNSDAYIDIYDFALQNKGNLWLHDARYSGLVFAKCFLREASGWDGVEKIASLANWRGYQGVDGDPGRFGREGALFIRPLFSRGKSKVIIHNKIAEGYVQTEASGLMYGPKIMKQPLVLFDETPPSDRLAPKRNEPLKVISLGFVSDGKMPEDVVAGCGIASSDRAIELTFCGQVHETVTQELQRQADLFPNLNLMFTGFQPMDTYRKTIRQSDVAIQLRREYNGESSATILDLLAGGIQVVTNFVNYDPELFELLTTLDPAQRGIGLHLAISEALEAPQMPKRKDIEMLFETRQPKKIMAKMLA